MSAKTKIVVLRMKEIIYTAIFIGFALLLILLFLAASIALVFFRLKKSTEELNKRVDSECHYRNMLVDASVMLHAFELRLNNDMIPGQDTEHIMALCVNEVKVQSTVSSAMITAGVSVLDVHIKDTVSSDLQKDTRYMMCVCDVGFLPVPICTSIASRIFL